MNNLKRFCKFWWITKFSEGGGGASGVTTVGHGWTKSRDPECRGPQGASECRGLPEFQTYLFKSAYIYKRSFNKIQNWRYIYSWTWTLRQWIPRTPLPINSVLRSFSVTPCAAVKALQHVTIESYIAGVVEKRSNHYSVRLWVICIVTVHCLVTANTRATS